MQQCWRCKMKEFLQHSLLFDSYRWTDHNEMQELYNRMLSEIPQGGFKPKTVENLKNHLRLFLCNLYVAYYYEKPIAISLKAEKFTHGRYHGLHIKRIPFTAIYQYLKEAGWIEYKTGFMPFSHDDDEKDCTGSLTRIWASPKLTAKFDKIINYLPEKEEQDCIVLRNENKEDIPFEENAFTNNLRNQLSFINSTLFSHYFTYNASDIFNKLVINPLHRNNNSNSSSTSSNISLSSLREPNEIFRRFRPQVKAVFSNADFSLGGRLYSAGLGDWQSMPQAQRKTIHIDNCRTVELDYNSFHISMLYAIGGKQISGDPYNSVAPKQMRPLIKKLLLTVLNASSIREAASSMVNQVFTLRSKPLLKERDLKFLKAWRRYNPNWYELIDRLNAAHPIIGQYFCSGAGLLLQRIDAQIMRNVLLKLAEKDIPCLPVHDSAIVQYFRANELQRTMQEAYEEQFPGFHCGIEAK